MVNSTLEKLVLMAINMNFWNKNVQPRHDVLHLGVCLWGFPKSEICCPKEGAN
jgi:hypothetical protein